MGDAKFQKGQRSCLFFVRLDMTASAFDRAELTASSAALFTIFPTTFRARDAHDVRSRPLLQRLIPWPRAPWKPLPQRLSQRARRGRKEKLLLQLQIETDSISLPEMCSLGGVCDPEHLMRRLCHLSPSLLGKNASSLEFVRSVYRVGPSADHKGRSASRGITTRTILG